MKKSTWFCDLRLRLVFLVLLAVIPALAVIFRAAEQQRSALALEAQQNALRTARLVSANQEVLIAGTRQLLTALANAPVVQNGDSSCSVFLRELLEKYPFYANLAVANIEGLQVCSALSLPTGPVRIADLTYFRRTMARRDFALGDYQIGRITAKATINAGYPLHDRAGKLIGIVYAAIDLTWLHGVAAKTRLPAGTTVTLVDRTGTIFVRYPDAENSVGQTMPDGMLREAILTQNGEGTLDAKGIDGLDRLYGFLPLLDGAATVIVGLPKEAVYATADRISAQSFWLIALASLLAVASAWWGGNWLIVRQVKSLTQAAEQLGRGDLRARVGLPQVGGEMQHLAAAFNRMAEALEQREADARRAEDELRLHLEKATALREMNLALTSTLDLQAVLKMLLEKIGQLWPGTAALVWLKNPDTGAWERTACWNFDEAAWKRRDPHALPPVVKAVIESRTPLVVADLTVDARILDHEFYRSQGLVSYLGVPLVVQGEALGILSFLTRSEHRFSAEEIDFFSMLAGQAAMAIHNSQLHAETKKQTLKVEKANRDLKRKEAIQALLKELNQDIASDDLDTLFKKLTNKVREFFKVDIADVRVRDHGPVILGISGIDEEKMLSSATGEAGGSRWVMEHRRPLILPDLNQAQDAPIGRGTARRLGIKGYIAVPLFSRSGEVVGVLRALSYRPRDFLAEEVDLLQQMANGAAVALENARLLEQTRRQADELSQANKVKNEFLGFVSHELRTPINIIMGYSALMEGGFCGEPNSEQAKVIDKIVVNSRALLGMIDQLLEATKIEAGAVKPEFQQVSLAEFVDELRSLYTVPNHKNIEIAWDYRADLPVVSTDPDKLRHVLTNLLGNAVKYTQSGTVALSAVNLPAEGVVEFQVADTGIGIPPEELPHIFDMFSQVRGTRARARSGGVGLGLHIVKKFTELLGGDISVTSEQGLGSTFTFRIPTRSADGTGQSDASLHTAAGSGA